MAMFYVFYIKFHWWSCNDLQFRHLFHIDILSIGNVSSLSMFSMYSYPLNLWTFLYLTSLQLIKYKNRFSTANYRRFFLFIFVLYCYFQDSYGLSKCDIVVCIYVLCARACVHIFLIRHYVKKKLFLSFYCFKTWCLNHKYMHESFLLFTK